MIDTRKLASNTTLDSDATPAEITDRLFEAWNELRGEIEATSQVLVGLRLDIAERDARVDRLKDRVRRLRAYAVAKRDELADDIAACASSPEDRALMQQALAHLFGLLDQTVRLAMEIR